jgi:hypothetical protein
LIVFPILTHRTHTDPTLRRNALLMHGPPISELPTSRLFAYATQLGAEPLGLEWVNDDTCVLVFASPASARAGLAKLRRDVSEEEDADGFWIAKSVPASLWPAKARIGATLTKAAASAGGGEGEGGGTMTSSATIEALKDVISLRWAKTGDVKARGAKGASEFYRKHGEGAGKEVWNPETGRAEVPASALPRDFKRRRSEGAPDGRWEHDLAEGGGRATEEERRRELDDEMDAFLEGREANKSGSAEGGREKWDRTSERVYPEDERRQEGGRGGSTDRRRGGEQNGSRSRREGGGGGHREGGRRRGGENRGSGEARPRKTAEELDAGEDSPSPGIGISGVADKMDPLQSWRRS